MKLLRPNRSAGGEQHLVEARRRRFIPRSGLALLATAVALVCFDSPLQAAWPPPETATAADMKNPANWPNDPGYGFDALSKPPKSGQWNFYSFIPDRSPGAPPLRAGETASGMSIDLAWRHTIGDDRVLISVLDCGVKWDEANLAEKAYLNKGELENHLPKHADGSDCAPLDPSKPGQDLFDCNGDGILTISDYADSPWLEPPASPGHPQGDANRNGILDAGDLIIMRDASGKLIVSDGTDDDGNGYVDDISGWDFMKNDNDPYDDTRYGHGTGEANDSSGGANDGIGDAGVCPKCRFQLLRVGDSFIADSQDFAKAAVYATDNGSSVIQEALGTIDMSGYAQAALDYAWSRGTIVIASMADENARHHNMPATSNHTLPVHAITMYGNNPDSTTTTSFLAFNTCTNYGAQNFLSASGTGCSSEATARLSGVSGLVYSMGLKAGYDGVTNPKLTAGEVMQLDMMTADDINIPESNQPDSPFFDSQPGFDQRFGYGRVNANTAVEWVKEGRIPPDIDLTSPRWFKVLYADQLNSPVPIVGTVSAKRAQSFDYVVEWAPGVQPLDDAFKAVEPKHENLTGVVGNDGNPLAQLDVRSLDVSHPRDPDSPHGENDYTITVRVRATAHYGGSIGDVTGELRRAYYVYKDPDLVSGFPVRIGDSGESSPKLADIDGDGVSDIILGTSGGLLHVYSMKSGMPEEVSGFPFEVKKLDGLDGDPTRPDYTKSPAYNAPDGVNPDLAREAIVPTPAVADMDGDGKLDIVLTTFSGTIYIVKNDGSVMKGWPVRLPDVPSCPLDGSKPPALCMGTTKNANGDDVNNVLDRGAFGSPVLADMDGDGKLDVIQAGFDGYVHIYKPDGTPLPGWPVRVHFKGLDEYNRILTTPAVADFNGDGTPDILVGSNEKLGAGGGAGAFYLIDGKTRKYMQHWPIKVTSFHLFPLVAEGVGNSAALADIDGDGKPDAILHGNASAPIILPADPGQQSPLGGLPPNALPVHAGPDGGAPEHGLEPTAIFGADSKAVRPDTMFPLFAQPSAGDLNQDGTPDIVTSGGSLSLAQQLLSKSAGNKLGQNLLAMWNGKTGAMFPGSPVVLEDMTFFNNQAIADIDGDGYPEVITGSGGYFVHAADACGREPEGWPKFTGQWVIATAAVGDIDGDGKLEVVVPSREGWLYAWHTKGDAKNGVISWESFHHDNRNTGDLDVKLDQGKLESGVGPLPIDQNGSCILPGSSGGSSKLEPTGGCGCNVPAAPADSGWLALLLGLPALLVLRRRA